MSGRIDFSMGFNTSAAGNKRQRDSQYRIYILGSFSGHSDVGWEQRKIHRIDSDNFEQVMAKIQPALEIDSGVRLRFESMDDFHPDAWMDKVKIIADLQVLKRQLSNPVTAEQAAAKIQAFLPAQDAASQDSKATLSVEETQDQMLQRLLGKAPEQPGEAADTVERMIEQIVAPFVAKSTEPQYQSLIATIDQVLSQCLRAILHDARFQKLEALWLATMALVNEESADEQRFFLLDISQAELAEQFNQDSQILTRTLLQHIQTDGDDQDVLLLGDLGFSDSVQDKQLLASCNALAVACGGYFLAAAAQPLLGVLAGESGGQYLQDIATDRMMLAYPRFLSRLPYGMKLDPIETFAFEECGDIPQPHELLWGCPAFIIARSLVRTSQPGGSPDALFFSDVPVFSFDKDGEKVLQPGTETVLTESQAHGLLAVGIMPLIGYRQMRGIRVMGITSLT